MVQADGLRSLNDKTNYWPSIP